MNLFWIFIIFGTFITLVVCFETKHLTPKVNIVDVPQETRDRYLKTYGANKGEGVSRWSSVGRSAQRQKVTNNITGYIYNAKPIVRGEYKDVVAVVVNGGYYCSGTVISDRYVFTTAYCCGDKDNRFMLVAGDITLNPSGGSCRDIQYDENGCKIHEKYDDYTYDYDVCLIKTANKFNMKKNTCIRPICLAKSKTASYIGKDLTHVGIGYPNLNDIIQWKAAKLQVKRLEECQAYYGDIEFSYGAQTICASGYKTESASCERDNSGGLRYETKGSISCLVGILYLRSDWCDPVAPVLFKRTSFFAEWIINIVGKNILCTCP